MAADALTGPRSIDASNARVLRRPTVTLPAASLAAATLLVAACAAAPPDHPAPPPAATAAPPASPRPTVEVAVTVDDLPSHGPLAPGVDRVAVAARMLEAFAKHRLPPVYGFVNGKKVDDDPALEAVLQRWLAAGNPLGNHSYSHPSLNRTALPEYLADIEKGEAILKRLAPGPAVWRLFRYPFLFEGDTVEKREGVRGYLRTRGYVAAHVSIDADDWAFNAPFARCAERADAPALAALRADYVTAHVEELRRMRALGHALVQRELRHVLLLHVGVADADAADALLTAYEREGVRWIELHAALSDPIYAMDGGPPVRYGAAFPYRAARSRGVSAPPPIFARGLEERLDRVCRDPERARRASGHDR